MDLGVIMPTHGTYVRDEQNFFIQQIKPEDSRPIEFGVMAEALGFHSVWFSDHVVMGRDLDMHYDSNESGKRAYPVRPTMFDAAPIMGALSALTKRIKFGTSIHVAPYRHPLVTAHQFATVDYISRGRVILGVGSGWEKDEFEALNADFQRRGSVTEESIAVYKAAWTMDFVEYQGEHFKIADVSMDPKPWRKPHPPVVFGGTTPRGARRAARVADGLYTTHGDPFKPLETWRPVREAALKEAEKNGRDLSKFWYGSTASILVCDADDPIVKSGRRPTLTGTADQVIDDLQRFADEHFQHLTLLPVTRTGAVSEMLEAVQRISEQVLPAANSIAAKSFA